MSKFVSTSNSLGEQTLYHAIPGEPRGEAIETSAHYGMPILPPERAKLGMPADAHTPLVFAATCLNKALAFAMPKGGGKLFNYTVDAANTEIIMACDRENFMARPIDATIYSFPADGFVQLPNAQHQSVSTTPVPFSKTKIVSKFGSMEDLMRGGLQIFTIDGNYKSLDGDATVDGLGKTDNDSDMMPQLAALIKSGKVIWENQSRGLNPNAKLAEMLGVTLAAVRRKPKRAPGL